MIRAVLLAIATVWIHLHLPQSSRHACDQESSKISITHLRDPAQPLFTTAGSVERRLTKPCSELATVLELARIANCCCYGLSDVSAALSAMRMKTDKTDAKGIAQILRAGWFSPVQMKSREAHGLRALLSARKALLKKTIDLANEARGLSNLAIAISAVLLCKPDDRQTQRIVISLCRLVLQGAQRQSYHPARPSLRRRKLLACVNDGLTELLCGLPLVTLLSQCTAGQRDPGL